MAGFQVTPEGIERNREFVDRSCGELIAMGFVCGNTRYESNKSYACFVMGIAHPPFYIIQLSDTRSAVYWKLLRPTSTVCQSKIAERRDHFPISICCQ